MDDPSDTPNTPADTPDDDVMAALDAGIEAAADTPAEPEPVEPEQPEAPTEPTEPTEPETPDTPAEPDAPEAPAEPEAKGVEDEIKDLGLKEKSAARFRELAAEREAMAPVREVMKELGFTESRQVVEALGRVRTADDIVSRVVDTGSNVEQFDKTLEYLALVNRGSTGDLAALEQAWALIEPEIKVLAQALGKEVPGIVDPLAEHADLRDAVEDGDITRAHALEVARARQQATLQNAGRQQAQQAQQAQAQQAEAVNAGRQALNDLGARLSAADPAAYQAKLPALKSVIGQIAQQYPPSEWEKRTLEAYATMPVPAPAAPVAPAKPAVGHVPLRATGGRPAVEPVVYEDPLAALDAGIAAARG